MKKIISYSLYNARTKDVVGAVVNCFLAKEIYKGWICRFYVDDSVPTQIRQALESFPHVEVVDMPSEVISGMANEKMLWRFLPASDEDVEVMISRDADSWLSHREKVCVDAFLESDKGFHIIRDHCYHCQKIMGGVWGVKNGVVPEMSELIDMWKKSGQGYDQGFLASLVYPKVVDTLLVHQGEQYDIRGQRVYGYQLADDGVTRLFNAGVPEGYINDGSVPMPDYEPSLENVGISNDNGELVCNFSFAYANRLNEFRCAHCGKIHDTFIGGIIENIPENVLDHVKAYFAEKGIDGEGLNRTDGLFQG